MTTNIETLQEWIDESSNIVFFSGPGMSMESGIPDFRHIDEQYFRKYDFPPDAILSRPFLERKPAQFFQFYRDKILSPLTSVEPNAAHQKLVELEAAGKLRMIITQNMDDLHQEAGSRKVLELFGSVMRNNCPRCERRLSALDILEHPSIPYCDADMCGGVIWPEIFLYGDALNEELMTNAIYNILSADLFIVAGTSLLDYPAAGFIYYYMRKKMVLINENPTAMDFRANLVIHAPISDVMSKIQVSVTP
jgi:NAD-dependent deacetylase